MAVLVEGLQGSGKSYYCMNYIHTNIDKYYKVFTNIDGVKTTQKIVLLEFKSFTDNELKKCYDIQVTNDGSFQDCIDYLVRVNYLPADVSKDNRILIVVDEAQNYFGKANKLNFVLQWFLTQHRHLFIEVILITQKYQLLRDEYKLFNVSYKAYPPVRQFNKTKFKYTEYAGLSYPPSNKVKNFTIPRKKEIFDMYVSGDKVDSPPILGRFFIYGLFFVIFIIVLVYYFKSQYSGVSDNNKTVEPSKSYIQKIADSTLHKSNTKKIASDSKIYYFFFINGMFHIDGYSKEFPSSVYRIVKKEYDLKVLHVIRDGYSTRMYISSTPDFLEFLGLVDKEKNKNALSLGM